MVPLADLHVHLLAGLDDGPRTAADAVAMARAMAAQGVRHAAALAHQNERYPDVTPARIREAARLLAEALRAERIELAVYPTAEVMLRPELEDLWQRGELMSVADRGRFVLLELPHDTFVDVAALARRLVAAGVRPILAHPERVPELLHERGAIDRLIAAGCLVQVSGKSITDPADRAAERAVRAWVKRGVVHLLGSDGHSPNRRPPNLAAAVDRVRRWAGAAVADRVGGVLGTAVLHDLPVRVPPPEPESRRWWAWW